MALYWILFVALALQSGAVYGQDISQYYNALNNQASALKTNGNLVLANLQKTLDDIDVSNVVNSKLSADISALSGIESQLNSVITSAKSVQKASSVLDSATNSVSSLASGLLGTVKKTTSKLTGGLF